MGFIGSGMSNTISGDWSVINGGYLNTINSGGEMSFIGGGAYNRVDSKYAMINAGYSNTIFGSSASGAVIGAGHYNTNSAPQGTIGGGLSNLISSSKAVGATISGGRFSEASGPGATVPGGFANKAAGTNSLAAGQQAVANNAGTFVWADMSTNADFESTANHQFLIRAKGGVGINTNNPGTNSLSIAGNVQVAGSVQIANIQVIAGSGAPTNSAPNASIYVNSASTNPVEMLYLNVGGGTNWFKILPP